MKEKVPILYERVFIITKKKSRIAARVILIILILVFLALAVAVLANPAHNSDAGQQNNFTFPEIVGNGSDGFVARNKASATIPATDGLELISGTVEQSLCMSNPDNNPCIFVISLYLGDGTLLFATEPLYPGETSEPVLLRHVLNSGVYQNATLVYDCYTTDGDMTPLTRCEIAVEINSK